jgi:hypothetical protein
MFCETERMHLERRNDRFPFSFFYGSAFECQRSSSVVGVRRRGRLEADVGESRRVGPDLDARGRRRHDKPLKLTVIYKKKLLSCKTKYRTYFCTVGRSSGQCATQLHIVAAPNLSTFVFVVRAEHGGWRLPCRARVPSGLWSGVANAAWFGPPMYSTMHLPRILIQLLPSSVVCRTRTVVLVSVILSKHAEVMCVLQVQSYILVFSRGPCDFLLAKHFTKFTSLLYTVDRCMQPLGLKS